MSNAMMSMQEKPLVCEPDNAGAPVASTPAPEELACVPPMAPPATVAAMAGTGSGTDVGRSSSNLELGRDYKGVAPTRNGVATGPHLYAGIDRDDDGVAQGVSSGGGLMSGPVGPATRADILAAHAHAGRWRDDEGRTNQGIEADAALARLQMEHDGPLGPFGGEFALLTANRHAKLNDETASVGWTKNLVEAAATVGTDEHNARFGLSLGAGGGARSHYGDADGDGIRELGFGADIPIGPLAGISFDVRSEHLGQLFNSGDSKGGLFGPGESGAPESAYDKAVNAGVATDQFLDKYLGDTAGDIGGGLVAGLGSALMTPLGIANDLLFGGQRHGE